MKRIGGLSDLAPRLAAGTRVVVHTGCAAPPRLSGQLLELARGQGPFRLFDLTTIGAPRYLPGLEDGSLQLSTFVPGRAVRPSLSAGRVEVWRRPLSAAPGGFASGELGCDLLLLHLSPSGPEGRMSLGIAVDTIRAALARRPLVVAEINPRVPRTAGDTSIGPEEVDFYIDAGEPLQTVPLARGDETDVAIADHIAGLIRNRDVIQTGIGAIPDLTVMRLSHLSDLGIHTGIITEAIQPLIEAGVVTNANKTRFRGVSVATMAAGSESFYRFLNGNAEIEFHACDVTHAAETLAEIPQLCAINGALEIDLRAVANAESLDGRRISGPGGQPDFAGGAVLARGGKSIIALRATSRDGARSRIVPTLADDAPCTTAPSQITHVVTEFGVAEIAGLSGIALAHALAAVASPDFRPELRRQLS